MNLGLAILLSSFFLGLIFLFHITKDRWTWKRFLIISMSLLFIGLVIFVVIYFVDDYNSKFHPWKVAEYGGVRIGMDKDDVLFARGHASQIDSIKNRWEYSLGYDGKLVIYFKRGIASSIVYFGSADSQPVLFYLDFVTKSTQYILSNIGENPAISIHPNKLSRIYSYPEYNLVFFLETNRIIGCGIYNPDDGQHKYGGGSL